MKNAICVKGLNFYYDDKSAFSLSHIDFKIEKGESVAFMGANGCGKSTLAYLLSGIIPYLVKGSVEGDITIFSQNIIKKNIFNEIATQLSFLFQNPEDLFLSFSVRDEFLLNAPHGNGINSNSIEDITNYLQNYNAAQFLNKSPREMSMGELQKISILIALYRNPKILVLDEPTTAIDIAGLSLITDILRLKTDVTKIIVTHDFNWAKKTCDRIIGIKENRILFDLSNSNCIFNDFVSLFNSNRLNHKLDLFNKLFEKLNQFSKRDNTFLDLSTSSLNFSYKKSKKKIINNFTYNVSSEYINCIMGPNGSGKTTLLYLFAGLLKPLNGHILYNGSSIRNKKVAIMMQNPSYLLISDTIREELLLSLKQISSNKEFIKDSMRIIQEILDIPDLAVSPYSLSFGWQKVLSFICCICLNPDVILLDEPELALDYDHKKIIAYLIQLMKKQNKLIILSSHEIEFTREVADRGIYMKDGEILKYDNVEELIDKYYES